VAVRRPLAVIETFYDAALDATLWPTALKMLTDLTGNPQPAMPEDEELFPKQLFPGWCRNYVGVRVTLVSGQPADIIENTITEMMDVPLAIRAAHAATVWKRDLANKQRVEDVERCKQAKTTLQVVFSY